MTGPDIFYFPPQQQPWMDGLFSVFGRALVLATRVESGVYAVAGMIDLRLDPRVLSSEESLRRFSDAIHKRPLAKVVRQLAQRDRRVFLHLFDVLDAARLARSELVHEATIGFEHWSQNEEESERQIKHVRVLVRRLAVADRAVSALQTLVSGEARPRSSAFSSYQRTLEGWVFSGWESKG